MILAAFSRVLNASFPSIALKPTKVQSRKVSNIRLRLCCEPVRQRHSSATDSSRKECVRLKAKPRRLKAEKKSDDCICVTFATADKYNMDGLISEILKDERFSAVHMPVEFYGAANVETNAESAIDVDQAPGQIFIFRNGVLSFWNIKSSVVESFLRLTRDHSQDIYPAELVRWESEEIPYGFHTGPSKFQNGKFMLSNDSSRADLALDKFAFSNALCSSVKLSHWEDSLDTLILSLESIPKDLIRGEKLKYYTPSSVLRKIGEIQLLRHRINLQHNLLDVPDAYWDREDLEELYTSTSRFLNITERVHLMNEKLTYCAHMVELLKTDLHEKRSLRVELLIVLLISIEVIFEVIHLFVLPYFTKGKQTQPADEDN